MFEKAIYDQFYKYLADNSMLSNCQSGFRKLHNTMTALLKSTDEWRLYIDKGQINGVVFIDLKKAFDTVDHSILINKLRGYGLNEQTLNFFTSYLENRSQRCFVNGHLSQKVSVRCGVPQGSILHVALCLMTPTATHNAARAGQGSRQTNQRRTDSYAQIVTQIGFAVALR